jgi:hypothetical protein
MCQTTREEISYISKSQNNRQKSMVMHARDAPYMAKCNTHVDNLDENENFI